MVRKAVVAGQFYPGAKNSLSEEIGSLVDKKLTREDAIGAVAPHAGYIYSGRVAGSVFSSIKPRNKYIIMGPNHTGLGKPFGVAGDNSWETPLGEVKIDDELRAAIMRNSKYIKEDDLSHSQEHSVEVQLPFLQYMQKDFTFVPIVISYSELDTYRAIGKEISSAIKELKIEKSVTIIASSDMTHYESQEEAKRKDSAAINAILKLDEAQLIERVSELDITMCGYAPAAIMIAAAKELGAKKARLVNYQTSGDATGDYSSVVGYAGIIIS